MYRQRSWIGMGVGLVGLVAVLVALYMLPGRGGTGTEGADLASVDGTGVDAADEAGSAGDVAMSAGEGEVRSFGSLSDNESEDGEGDSGRALRVVTDETSMAGSGDTTTSSSTSTTAPSTTSSSTTTAPSSSTSTSTSTTAVADSGDDGSNGDTTSTSEGRTTTTAAQSTTSTTVATTESTTTTRPTTTAPNNSSEARTFEQEVIRLTNAERAAGGCGPLANNDKLHAAALGHSVDMAENDYFSHTSRDGSSMSDRVNRQGYQWRGLAENIAAGYRTPASVVDGWMNSQGHRDNIMNCNYTEIGVGFHDYYWTQNFGIPR